MQETRKRVLFVDDDIDLLDLVKPLMARYAGDAWEVLTASEVSQALVILQQRKIHLLVIDVRMPVVDGVQFLGLLQRKYPHLTKVVLTAEPTEEHRSACLGNGAELFLEKPRHESGWRAIHAMLCELIKLQPEAGFTGLLRRVGLQDVLQMECLARNSVILEIRAGERRGAIYVQDGQIVHAELGATAGEAAFNELMGLKGGEFELRPWAEPPQRSVDGSWEFLLMEAARTRDELTHAPPPSPADDTPFAPPENPSRQETATVVPEFGGPGELTNSADPIALLDAAAGTPDQVDPPRVEEILICSLQGEVLHEWQCDNTTSRVGFLEFISKKARQLGHNLPLGGFERLEVNGASHRAIAQIQPDRALFVRTKRTRGRSSAPDTRPVQP